MATTTERETALVTGASSGIGADIARELAARGYDLVLTARRADRLEALRAEIEAGDQRRAQVVTADLGAPGGADELIRRVEALGVPISFLVNNAGFAVHGDFLDHERDKLEQMLQLNMHALTLLTWHFGRAMRARGRGRILQVASIGAYSPSPYYAAYDGTKAYVLFLSEAVNYELRGTGVTVSTLCPGVTETEFHAVAAHPKKGLTALSMNSARAVARTGVRGALRGKAVINAGLDTRLTAFLMKIIPRSWANALGGMLMR